MTDAQVCIPWRPTPDRIPAFRRCVRYWEDYGFAVMTADSDPDQPFHCNQARNRAVGMTTTEIVIIADGDTLPETIGQITEAIEIVRACPETVVWPYTTYVYVFAWEVDNPDLSQAQVVHVLEDMSAGIIVIHKDTFAELGGFDENFTPGAWGYDDLAFHHVAQTLTSTVRLSGRVYSFEHEARRDTSDENPNKRRWNEVYAPADGDPELMREVIRRRYKGNGPVPRQASHR